MPNFVVRFALPTLAALAAVAAPLAAQDKQPQQQPVDINSFEAVKVVSDPQMAPNGSTVLYAVRTTSLGTNSRSSLTYKVAAGGGIATAFPDASTSASEARWSPDGKRVAYIAGGQLWVADPMGGARKQLTTLAGGATGPIWSPSGDRIAFTSRVYPSCADDACNVARQKAADSNPVKAHIADELMYRHWNAWDDGTRAHLFVVGADGNGVLDLTPGAIYDVPPGPFGGSEGYAWAPDGRELSYTAKDAGRENAWSTDNNLYTVPSAGGKPVVITAANKGADENPVYSPDGKLILYHSQARAGFESDRWRLMAYDRSSRQSRELLPQWDRNADSYAFAADGRAILIQTVDASREKFYRSAFSNGNRCARRRSCCRSATMRRCRSTERGARWRGCRTPRTAPPRYSSPRWAPACRGCTSSRTRTTRCSRRSRCIRLRTTGSRAPTATACRG